MYPQKTTRSSLTALIIVSLLLTCPVSASVILTDHPVYGVNSIIRDQSNNRDFLRLDFTDPYTYNEVINEFGAGGLFAGCRVASLQDMEDLGVSADIVQGSSDPLILANAEQLRDWFGSVRLTTTHEVCRGLISDTYDATNQKAFTIGRRFNVDPHEVDFRVSGYGGLDDSGEQVFLVIPEPMSLSLLLFGTVSLLYRRHRLCN